MWVAFQSLDFFPFSFYVLFCFETRSHYIVLSSITLIIWADLALKSWSSSWQPPNVWPCPAPRLNFPHQWKPFDNIYINWVLELGMAIRLEEEAAFRSWFCGSLAHQPSKFPSLNTVFPIFTVVTSPFLHMELCRMGWCYSSQDTLTPPPQC